MIFMFWKIICLFKFFLEYMVIFFYYYIFFYSILIMKGFLVYRFFSCCCMFLMILVNFFWCYNIGCIWNYWLLWFCCLLKWCYKVWKNCFLLIIENLLKIVLIWDFYCLLLIFYCFLKIWYLLFNILYYLILKLFLFVYNVYFL